MRSFPLKIVTPDGLRFEGEAERLTVRTIEGDIGILAGHVNCVVPLGAGRATIVDGEGQRRYGACIGGMLSVMNGSVTLVPTTFEWAETIDEARVEASMARAQKILDSKDSSANDIRLAEARLRRALVRKGVASFK